MSFFYFPFEFIALPGINTKMMLAVLGIIIFVIRMLSGSSKQVSRDFLILAFFVFCVSLVSLLSVVINRTPDLSYVSYWVSFTVWLSAAFAVSNIVWWVHGRIDIKLIISYLAGVCLFQCIISLFIDNNEAVRDFVDSHFALDQVLMHKINRLYGIGAELDVAGVRFSLVLVGLSFFIGDSSSQNTFTERNYFIIAFMFITIIGNMMARTTLIGTSIGLGVIILRLFYVTKKKGLGERGTVLLPLIGFLSLSIVISVLLYNANEQARHLFRFAFEGFFSLVEEGHWATDSTDKLQTMVVFPETIHTWIIGDGYFMNSMYDPNYIGRATRWGYYMGTDVGYLRFIFYYGVVGLSAIMGVIIQAAIFCMRRYPNEKLFFIMALLVGLIVWFKVSTDVFSFFALFIAASSLKAEPAK